MFESLESRTLLSASVKDDVLVINGTAKADTITVTGGTFATANQLMVTINGDLQMFPDSVKKVKVNAKGGNDDVRLAQIDLSLPIKGYIIGGPGDDELHGTTKNDTLEGNGGNDTISGLQGKDKIVGGKGKDVLAGGPGKDDINGGPGKDEVSPSSTPPSSTKAFSSHADDETVDTSAYAALEAMIEA